MDIKSSIGECSIKIYVKERGYVSAILTFFAEKNLVFEGSGGGIKRCPVVRKAIKYLTITELLLSSRTVRTWQYIF